MRPITSMDLFLSRNPGQMAEAARDIGHAIVIRNARDLAALRSDLADAAEHFGPSSYERGFLDAIEHLLVGFSAESEHRRLLEADTKATRIRPNAAKVLLAMHEGGYLPKDIASRAKLQLSTVSTTLGELESDGLVEKLTPEAGGDRRTAPRQLTIRGRQITAQLALSEESAAIFPWENATARMQPFSAAEASQVQWDAGSEPRVVEIATNPGTGKKRLKTPASSLGQGTQPRNARSSGRAARKPSSKPSAKKELDS